MPSRMQHIRGAKETGMRAKGLTRHASVLHEQSAALGGHIEEAYPGNLTLLVTLGGCCRLSRTYSMVS